MWRAVLDVLLIAAAPFLVWGTLATVIVTEGNLFFVLPILAATVGCPMLGVALCIRDLNRGRIGRLNLALVAAAFAVVLLVGLVAAVEL